MKLAAGALLFVGACFNPTFNNPRCGPNDECPPGQSCIDGLCRMGSPSDANGGNDDGASDDGGPNDGGIDARMPIASCQNDPDLVACYRFEANGSTADDQTTNNNDAPCSGGTTIVTGKIGNAMSFNGGNAGCQAPTTASLTVPVVTMEAWVNFSVIPAGGSSRYGIIDKDAVYALHFYGDRTMRCTTGSGQLSVMLTTPVGQWTHIACTHDGTIMRMYQDGVQIGMQPASGQLSNSPTPLAIGMNSPSGDNLFGKLDEVKIWRRALTAAEICNEVGC